MADARNIALLFWKTQREESREIAENHAKLARRRLYRYLRRRSLVSSVFLLLLTRQLFQCAPSLRRLWSKNRSQSFWEETCQGWSDNDWVENFRMSKDSFEYLCAELSPHIAKRDTNFRKAIAVRHRVAIALYWLADSARYRTIGNLFGVGKSTVCTIVKQVCEEPAPVSGEILDPLSFAFPLFPILGSPLPCRFSFEEALVSRLLILHKGLKRFIELCKYIRGGFPLFICL